MTTRPDGVPPVTVLRWCPSCRRQGPFGPAHLVRPQDTDSPWCEGELETYVYRFVGPLVPAESPPCAPATHVEHRPVTDVVPDL